MEITEFTPAELLSGIFKGVSEDACKLQITFAVLNVDTSEKSLSPQLLLAFTRQK